MGAPGSGTDIIGNALALCGFSAGKVTARTVSPLSARRLRPEPSVYIQKSIADMNETILRTFGSAMFRPNVIQDYFSPEVSDISTHLSAFETLVANALRSTFDEQTLSDGDVVLYDSGFCYTLPVWTRILTDLGFIVTPLFVFQNHLEAYGDSLEMDADLKFEHFALSYAGHSLAALGILPAGSRVVSLSDFETDPAKALSKLKKSKKKSDARIADLAALCAGKKFKGVKAQNPVSHGVASFVSQMTQVPKDLVDNQKYTSRVRMLENNLRAQDRVILLDPNEDVPVPDFLPIPDERRPLVVHIHLFKNAGTSVDGVLKKNFGDAWLEHEFPTTLSYTNSDLVKRYAAMRPHVQALSTHTGNWLLDDSDLLFDVIPIVFVRNPILRVKSAFAFEKNQHADTEGARLARQTDLAGYVRARLENENDFAFNNFQSRRLSLFFNRLIGNEEINGLRAVEKLPFVGLVEEFDLSMKKYSDLIREKFPHFEEFSLKANVSNTSNLTTEQMLQAIRDEIGDELYGALESANQADLALVDYVRERHFS